MHCNKKSEIDLYGPGFLNKSPWCILILGDHAIKPRYFGVARANPSANHRQERSPAKPGINQEKFNEFLGGLRGAKRRLNLPHERESSPVRIIFFIFLNFYMLVFYSKYYLRLPLTQFETASRHLKNRVGKTFALNFTNATSGDSPRETQNLSINTSSNKNICTDERTNSINKYMFPMLCPPGGFHTDQAGELSLSKMIRKKGFLRYKLPTSRTFKEINFFDEENPLNLDYSPKAKFFGSCKVSKYLEEVNGAQQRDQHSASILSLSTEKISNGNWGFAPQRNPKNKKVISEWICYSESQYLANSDSKKWPGKARQLNSSNQKSSISSSISTNILGVLPAEPKSSSGQSPRQVINDIVFERQTILECYKKRNLLRLFLAFFDFQGFSGNSSALSLLSNAKLSRLETRNRLISQAGSKSWGAKPHFAPETESTLQSAKHASQGAKNNKIGPSDLRSTWVSRLCSRSEQFSTFGPLRHFLPNAFLTKIFEKKDFAVQSTIFQSAFQFLGLTGIINRSRQMFQQVFREISIQIFLQILIIPYTFLFGIFYTCTSFNLSSTLTSKVSSGLLASGWESAHVFPGFPGAKPSLMSSASPGAELFGVPLSSVAQPTNKRIVSSLPIPIVTEKTISLGIDPIKGVVTQKILQNDTGSFLYSYSIQFHSFAEEILRLSHFSSKIFILWGFLNIWKGVRPAKATRNDYVIQTRLLPSRKNKKRFSDLEGIEKFFPVLKTLVESFQMNFFPSKLSKASPNSTKLDILGIARPGGGAIRDRGHFESQKNQVGKAPLKHATFAEQGRPKGYLFIGPPGTGKTLLAQAVAGEAKVNLICLSASEIQKQIDIGTRIGAIRLRNLFEQARKNTPCILFLDEIDAIGRARNETADLKLFTEFLIQMDSFTVKSGFIVIGTTNFLSSLDSAFVRSGRFDRIIGLKYPGKQTRIDILKLYTKKQGFDQTISWNYFGQITKGLSAADLAKVVNESSLYLIEKNFLKRFAGGFSPSQELNVEIGYELESETSLHSQTNSIQKRNFPNETRKTHFLTWLAVHAGQRKNPKLVHTSLSLERGIQRITHSLNH